jgi:hypothetical protein
MKKVMIACKICQKIIEKKGNRELCIHCTNIRSRELAAAKRATPEYKEYQKRMHDMKKRG